MDVAELSVGLSQAKLQQQAAISVTKLAMDTAQTKGNMISELAATVSKSTIEQSVMPNLGKNMMLDERTRHSIC